VEFLQAVQTANIEIYNFFKSVPRDFLCAKLSKGYGGDISVRADIEAEKIFIKHLSRFGTIYSEECGIVKGGGDLIVVDPIDGSDNFISNIPFYGSSVAKIRNGVTTHAIVTNLAQSVSYVKTDNFFEKRPLFEGETLKITANNHSKVGIFEKSYSSSKLHDFLKNNNLKYRSMGALALSLSLAHEVNFTLYEGKAREFDIAAGWHMCEDLFRFKNDKVLLVSKDKGIFDKISHFIKE
jgi:myo-inositol-1(or 4)-monophosphatase